MPPLDHVEKEKWIEDYVERETTGARKRAEDAEAAIEQEQEDIQAAENLGLMTRKPEKMFHQMMVAIIDRRTNIESSDTREDGEDKDDKDIVQLQLSEDDETSWAMGTITKMDAAALGVVKLAADEASPIETTRMGGCSLLLP
jgi:nitrate reductase beta subunit